MNINNEKDNKIKLTRDLIGTGIILGTTVGLVVVTGTETLTSDVTLMLYGACIVGTAVSIHRYAKKDKELKNIAEYKRIDEQKKLIKK